MELKNNPKSLMMYSIAISCILISASFAFSKYTLYLEYELNKRQHALDILEEIHTCYKEWGDAAANCADRAKSLLVDSHNVWTDLEDADQ